MSNLPPASLESAETCAPTAQLMSKVNPATNLESLEKKIFRSVGQAIGDFNLIEEGDKILVGVSGGKDSWTLLHVLSEMQKRAPINYELFAVNLDQGYA